MAPSATEQTDVTYEDLIQLEQEFEDADQQISACSPIQKLKARG